MSMLSERSVLLKRALLTGRSSKKIQMHDKFLSGRPTIKMKMRNITFGRKRDYKRLQKWV